MKPRVPAMAKWLLDRFGVPLQNEALMGDLEEERSSGRSALWFWRQTLVAIAVTATRDLGNHAVLAGRAIATGWILNLAWDGVMNLLGGDRYQLWRYHMKLWVVLSLFSFVPWPAIVAWVVARTHRSQQAAMVLAYAGSVAIVNIVQLSAGYAEMHRIPRTYPDLWSTNVALACIALFFTIIGGFLPKPSQSVGN